VPERSTSFVVLRQPNLPAGLSVDAAWQRSTGRPQVLLAILDDGIDYTEPELTDAIFLNLGELRKTPPTHADGSSCAPLDPSSAASPAVDCASPPDGVLTLADYREKLGWVDGTTGRDPNENGRLDVADLFLLGYMDGIDDDGNGFVDDLAGWDFVESDNMPFSALSGSGTEAALDAAARSNDGNGRAGTCPGCRVLPIRVGHQRGSNPQTLALGLLYASSFGSAAALVGHLPSGRTRALDAALRLSAQRNQLMLFPRDGEQQRIPFLRFDTNAAQVIGNLTQLGGSTTSTASFIAQDPCQTAETGPVLMSASPACSRRGPAVALGIAGLLVSARRETPELPRLAASQLASLLAQSADDVSPDTAADAKLTVSDRAAPRRLNARAALDDLSAKLVPPELELERPLWYETVVLDSLTQPMPITGRVAVLSGATFDVHIEAALNKGNEPGKFTPLIARRTMSAESLVKSGSLLAQADLRTWYGNAVSTAGDGDSTSDSDATGAVVTLHVRVVDRGQQTLLGEPALESSIQRQIIIVTDSALMSGFPYVSESGTTPPKLFDVDGVPGKEIVFGTVDGRVLALSTQNGTPKDAFQTSVISRQLPQYRQLGTWSPSSQTEKAPPILAGTPSVSASLGTESIVGGIAAADFDRDGMLEVVFASDTGRVYAVDHTGARVDGWPRCLDTENGVDCPNETPGVPKISSAPVIADVDGDGDDEIVIAANDGALHAFERNAKKTLGWPVRITMPTGDAAGPITDSPSTADLDGDSRADLVFSAGEPRDPNANDATQGFTLLGVLSEPKPSTGSPSADADAEDPGAIVATGWPLALTSYDFDTDRLTRRSPPTAIDAASSEPRALLYGNATRPFFVPLAPGVIDNETGLPRQAEPGLGEDGERGFTLTERGLDSAVTDAALFAPLYARPTLADLDRDGRTDLILPGTTGSSLDALRDPSITEHRSLLLFWSGRTGKMLPASPILLGDFIGAATPVVADLTGDGYPEMIVPTGDGRLAAYDACGRSPEGWPKVLGGPMSQSAAVGDVDGDGTLEVVAITDDGRVFAWHTGASDQSYVPWESAQHDLRNQSAHRMPVSSSPQFPPPLPLTSTGKCVKKPEAPSPPTPRAQLSARGGCDCRVPADGDQTGTRGSLLVLAGIGLGLWRRRITRSRRHSPT
jgi:hypothetical protein